MSRVQPEGVAAVDGARRLDPADRGDAVAVRPALDHQLLALPAGLARAQRDHAAVGDQDRVEGVGEVGVVLLAAARARSRRGRSAARTARRAGAGRGPGRPRAGSPGRGRRRRGRTPRRGASPAPRGGGRSCSVRRRCGSVLRLGHATTRLDCSRMRKSTITARSTTRRSARRGRRGRRLPDFDRHRQETVWRMLSADRQALLRFCQRQGVTVGTMDSIKTLKSPKPLLQLIATATTPTRLPGGRRPPSALTRWTIVVDFDGTITERDTLDAMCRAAPRSDYERPRRNCCRRDHLHECIRREFVTIRGDHDEDRRRGGRGSARAEQGSRSSCGLPRRPGIEWWSSRAGSSH